jgi:dienelactone hydrolase
MYQSRSSAVLLASSLLGLLGGCATDEDVPVAAEVARAVRSTDPAQAGQFEVISRDAVQIPVTDGRVTASLCAPRAEGRFPAIVLSPGFMMDRSQYRSMCNHLASWGYVVVLQSYSQSGFSIDHRKVAADVGDIIDWMLGAQSGLAAVVDPDRLAVAGHSLGGKVSVLAAVLEPRIKAVVGWDPVDARSPSVTPELMSQLRVPLLVVGETLDSRGGFQPCAPGEQNYQRYFESACSSPRAIEVTVADADHMDWLDDRGSCGFTCMFCSNGSRRDAETREITRRAMTAFLESVLRGSEELDSWLDAATLGSNVQVRSAPTCN